MNFKKTLKAAALGLALACVSGGAFADDSGLSKRAMQQCQQIREITLIMAHNYADVDKANRSETAFRGFIRHKALKAPNAGLRYLTLGMGRFIIGFDENLDKDPEEFADYMFEVCKDIGPGQLEQDLLDLGEEMERYMR